MSDQFYGEIRAVPFNFAPREWAFCNGTLINIAQNTALFSLLGTTYGGDGKTTFALPDLRGRAVLCAGDGPGLTSRSEGETGGQATVTLIPGELPSHTHAGKNASSAAGTTRSPVNAVPAMESANVTQPYRTGSAPDITITGGSVGGDQPHENMQPYLALNYIIALNGIFPQRH